MASRSSSLINNIAGAVKRLVPGSSTANGTESLAAARPSNYSHSSDHIPPNTAASVVYNTTPQTSPVSPRYRDNFIKRSLYNHSVLSVSFVLGALGILMPTVAFLLREEEELPLEQQPGYPKYYVDRQKYLRSDGNESLLAAFRQSMKETYPDEPPADGSLPAADQQKFLHWLDSHNTPQHGLVRIGHFLIKKQDLRDFIANHPAYQKETATDHQ